MSPFTQRTRAALLAALVLAVGCVDDTDDTGVPQPVPIPGPNSDYVRSTGALRGSDTTDVHVVGLPGAVAEAGEVIVSNTRLDLQQKTDSDDGGSFAAFIKAAADDELTLEFVGSDEIATIKVGEKNIGLIEPMPTPIDGVEPITIDGQDAIVRGKAMGFSAVIAVNLSTGRSTTAKVQTDDSFEIRIAAASADELRVYGDREPLSEPWLLTMP